MIQEVPKGGGGNRTAARPAVRANPVTTIIVAYIAVQQNAMFVHYANQFVSTYRQFQGGAKHRLIVCCNGGKLAFKMKAIFDPIDCEFFERPNDEGWDISAYQDVAMKNESELLVCFGESVRFHRAGWLTRLVDSANEHGEGMYGCFSSHAIRPHLNTTAFAVSPRFLRQYPRVKNKAERYEFEHGAKAFWNWVNVNGATARLVTWDGCWPVGSWRMPNNILWRGDQSNCLVFSNHTDKWLGKDHQTRERWTARADGIEK